MPRERIGRNQVTLLLEYAVMAAELENVHRDLSLTLYYVCGEMAQWEVQFAVTNKELKEAKSTFSSVVS